MSREHTNKEKARILAHSVLKINDIRILMDCGPNKACEMSVKFKAWHKDRYGYETDQIPTELFIKFTDYPEKRVLKYAELGY